MTLEQRLMKVESMKSYLKLLLEMSENTVYSLYEDDIESIKKEIENEYKAIGCAECDVSPENNWNNVASKRGFATAIKEFNDKKRLSNYPTAVLLEELAKREGVKEITYGPHQRGRISMAHKGVGIEIDENFDGPVRVLVVSD